MKTLDLYIGSFPLHIYKYKSKISNGNMEVGEK